MARFSEVFPTLKLNDYLYRITREVTVEKITMTAAQDRITVYLCSSLVISKKNIYQLEQLLKRELTGNSDLKVNIVERFVLSDIVKPEDIWKEYRESILLELMQKSPVLEQIIENAKAEFSGDKQLKLTLRHSMLAADKENEIRSYLAGLFSRRFGMDVGIDISFVKQKTDTEKARQEKLEYEVQKILRSAAESREVKVKDKSENPGRAKGKAQRTTDEGMIFGRNFDGEAIPMNELFNEAGDIIVRGRITAIAEKPIRNEKTILTFTLTDNTDSITAKMFVKNEEKGEILESFAPGRTIRMKGFADVDKFDGEYGILRIIGVKEEPEFIRPRRDFAPVKRVELHCHTKASDMDGLTSAADIVKGAVSLGHPGVAITDHGVVHAFPEAFHVIRDLKKKSPDKVPEGFKVIYGMEGYVVDDLISLVIDGKGQRLSEPCVVFDLETTGFSSTKNEIIEIGAVKIVNGEIVDRLSTFVDPECAIPFRITELTSITDTMVEGAPKLEEAMDMFLEFSKGCMLVAHNAPFDLGFIKEKCRKLGKDCDFTGLDTVSIARVMLPDLARFKLDVVAKRLGVSLEHHHRAVDDAECTALIYLKFLEMFKSRGIETVDELQEMGKLTPEMMKRLPRHHIILLAKNEEGRKNLYRLVSKSHLTYYFKKPRLPKSEILKHREGLILSSACVSGELFDALLSQRSAEVINNIVQFYDYLEIQPIANNRFLIDEPKFPEITSDEDLREFNREIVRLGEQFNKPVCATCDVHFFNPEDEICRRIIQFGNGFKDADKPEPLFFRTTEEMLEEFSYLGESKAEEVVITNTRKIADMVEEIEPVRPDKCPPVIENSEQDLRDCCYARAREIYGEEVPGPVEERLEKELKSIIGNGYAVMYIIARKLVLKSNEDGYLVGSRGSVGSSLVAFMSGITEVNSMSPHYYCPNCHYSDFDSELVKSYWDKCGLDMPKRDCPVCGKPLKKDGWNIPFETFLGFKGDKEPDIDLNFSGDYQAQAHKYTEVIFGEGHTFKAGTIATLADKTAYGYVMNYFKDHNEPKRKCEIERLTDKCKGVRRSTGQHPGGIIVLPHGEEIDTFTPVQHPANDMSTDIVTTHFDYHSIDHNLLKLDILGHDDPTMVRRLQDMTGLESTEIPLDDPEVFELFHSTKSLGIEPKDIHGCKLGCLGVPEFGTDFVIGLVEDAKPRAFSDLIRISGLSHGTNVWLDNAQTLIKEGIVDIGGAICTRDDIMVYLIGKGMDPALSFKIMESVRKGRGLTDEWEQAMKDNGVPDWYIWSCKRISYMFPKAHAVAYVTMALRIAYCKVHYPLAYYGAYFAIRASAFSYELMCLGKDKLRMNFERIRALENKTPKDEDTLKDMRIVEEMYARGFEFEPIDIYKAHPKNFEIVNGKLMPSLLSIDGMGEKAAEALAQAAKEGPFLSREDLKNRSHISKTVIDKMGELGLLEGLPESNQLSIFDTLM